MTDDPNTHPVQNQDTNNPASPQDGTGTTTSPQAADQVESPQALIDAKVEQQKHAEADRRAQAAEAKRVAGIQAERGPLVGQNPAIEGPTAHGEAAQRFVNKTSAHSERTVNGGVVTPVVRKERYEHPERKA